MLHALYLKRNMKEITALIISLIFSFAVSGQKTIELGECEILRIDSITLCSSHYSITVLTSVDTFTTVIPKSVIKLPLKELTGITRKISAEPMDSIFLNIDSNLVLIALVGSVGSHPDYDQYDQISYTWKVKKNFWKKEEIELKLSCYYQDKKQTNLMITKIE